MKNDYFIYAAIVLAFLILLAYAGSGQADMYYDYYSEEIPYVFRTGTPYPEHTKYTCENNKLIKKYHGIVYDYTGKPVECEIKLMTRKEYEEYNGI